jgi:hypothetical protein
MSQIGASETRPSTESKPRYSKEELLGKGLQRLSYFVESQYVTRGFKNHLKSLQIFRPAYRKQDRQGVFLERPAIRRYSDKISNRKFKWEYIRTHRTVKGLKDQPRTLIPQQPLRIGTVIRSKGVFYPDPFLDKRERKLARLPSLRTRSFLKKTFRQVRRALRGASQDGSPDPGSTQVESRPVESVSSDRTRVAVLVLNGEYIKLLGGVTVSRETFDRVWHSKTKNFRFFSIPSDGTSRVSTRRWRS